jgi:hypothetical protein
MSKTARMMAVLITAMFLTVLLPTSFMGDGANYPKQTTVNVVDASFVGNQIGGRAGYGEFVTSKGDVNGDGYGDLIISGAQLTNGSNTKAGKVFLFFGKASGWAKDLSLYTANVVFTGENLNDWMGDSCSIVRDINGDGLDDIVLGAGRALNGKGIAYIIFGAKSGWVSTYWVSNASATIVGETIFDRVGSFVSGAGDINGDGFNDLMLGSANKQGAVSNEGKVSIFFGKATGWVKGALLSSANASFWGAPNSSLGGYMMGPGDINGDHLDDLVMAGPSYNVNAGKVYIVFGKASGWSTNVDLEVSADASIVGYLQSGWMGCGLTLAGDFNGDGFHDIVINAEADDAVATDSGQVYIFFGKASGWAKNVNVSKADASFRGSMANENVGYM